LPAPLVEDTLEETLETFNRCASNPMNQSLNITDSHFEIQPTLLLPDNEVHLWRVDLENVRAEEPRWEPMLSADEKHRASRFIFPADRQRFIAARALLRTILAGYLTADPCSLTFIYSKRDKPSLAAPYGASEITFNLSHSGGVALYAITRRREVGVDIEQMRRNSDLEGIARRFFSAHEQRQLEGLPAEEKVHAFFRCWARKESYIKATGDGLSLPLSQFDVSLEAGSTNALVATRPDRSEAALWQLREIPAGIGYAAALCIKGHDCQLRSWSHDSV
jgi:4'-phosphopantetheinyl transferase